MATAQEILAKIKESKRKENENLFRMAENAIVTGKQIGRAHV